MIPFDPKDESYLWWQTWSYHMKHAKQYPESSNSYCRAAAIAHTQYRCFMAQKIVAEYY